MLKKMQDTDIEQEVQTKKVETQKNIAELQSTFAEKNKRIDEIDEAIRKLKSERELTMQMIHTINGSYQAYTNNIQWLDKLIQPEN